MELRSVEIDACKNALNDALFLLKSISETENEDDVSVYSEIVRDKCQAVQDLMHKIK
jgi:hypothetical protein